MPSPADDEPRADAAAPIAHLETKARALLLGVLLLIVASIVYVLYARGAFERTQTLVLVADNAEGVAVSGAQGRPPQA